MGNTRGTAKCSFERKLKPVQVENALYVNITTQNGIAYKMYF